MIPRFMLIAIDLAVSKTRIITSFISFIFDELYFCIKNKMLYLNDFSDFYNNLVNMHNINSFR